MGNLLADDWEEEEMEEGNDSDGSWVDVSHSEDEGEVSLVFSLLTMVFMHFPVWVSTIKTLL